MSLQVAAPTTRSLLRVVNVREHGAKGNGTTDDTAAINRAKAIAEAFGWPLYFPRGLYKHTGLSFLASTVLLGVGRGLSILVLDSSVSSSTDGVVVTGTTSAAAGTPGGMFDLQLTAATGTTGRHGLRFDLSAAGAWLVGYVLERVYIFGANRAISNSMGSTDAAVNYFALNNMRNCWFNGGVQLLGVHDSNTIQGSYFAGANVGLELSTTGGAGANAFLHNNVVSNGGGVWIKTVSGNTFSNMQIIGNYFEKLSAWVGGSGNGALIDLDATGASEILSPVIRDNQVSVLAGYGGSGKSCVRLKNVSKAIVDGNNIHPIDASTVGILLTTGTDGSFLGAGNRQGAGSGTLVSNTSDLTAIDLTAVRQGQRTLASGVTISLGATAVGEIQLYSADIGQAAIGYLHGLGNAVTPSIATNYGGAGTGFTLGADTGTGFSVYHDGTVYRIKNRNASALRLQYRFDGLVA